MPVTARSDYIGEPRESTEKYGDNQLLFVSWDHHLLFAAPFALCLPKAMSFGELLHGPLAQILAPDPDAAKIDWDAVTWSKSDEAFSPDPAKSLADNGIEHKEQLRFVTPGLNTICSTG